MSIHIEIDWLSCSWQLTRHCAADETTNGGQGKIRQAIYKEKVLFPWLNILITSFSAVTEMPELARDTMVMAQACRDMVEDGLSRHGPWKSSIRKLACKIQNEPGMGHYFTNIYARE
ncbi:predicted protein [Histoplasma capsulatum var. duboisii H88]|uniref:Predicted protein n=1 Tax=Ajellomyces capsulatus (strain H88) TaxID=544711 RepID=F0U6E0_AJEC8|nr:predicted protein [Histoplasma capsulatum var. duboisii H88]